MIGDEHNFNWDAFNQYAVNVMIESPTILDVLMVITMINKICMKMLIASVMKKDAMTIIPPSKQKY